MKKHKPDLTSSEIASLWGSYMSDSLNCCIMEHFIATVNDNNIKGLLIHSNKLSRSHLETITQIFKNENIPIPNGFTQSDVNMEAPKLYSDTFYLRYLEAMSRSGMAIYSMALGTSYRKDIRDFYFKGLTNTGKLYNDITEALEKFGNLVRTPYIPYPRKVEYIQDDHFMAGFLTLHPRPLLAIEINHLSNNIESNFIGKTLIAGFAQVAETTEVRKHFQKGVSLAVEIINILSKSIDHNHTDTPFSADSTITESTLPPFSDKLMLACISSLNVLSMNALGQGLAASLRTDLIGKYTDSIAKVGKFAHEGAKIGIKNRWIEKPPQTIDREALQKQV